MIYTSYLQLLTLLLVYPVCLLAADSFPCVTDANARSIVADFTVIASEQPGYVKVAKKLLTSAFASISDSVNFADQVPLNTTLTHSRAELLKQEAKLPRTGEVKDLFISHTCDTITWYFEFATTPLPTCGIAILIVDADHKVYKAYREVNSAALLYNLGQPECQSNFTVSVGTAGLSLQRRIALSLVPSYESCTYEDDGWSTCM